MEVIETEIAIKKIKDFFEKRLAKKLNLLRVSAPLFVEKSTGLDDNLSGIESPINFFVQNQELEIVHSLAKWKRNALYKYAFPIGLGLYTDMNAIRKDENLDAIHSLYVDQWDWEKIISKTMRTEAYLTETVKKIYQAIKELEHFVVKNYGFSKKLPKEIKFITSQELENRYPDHSGKKREDLICEEYRAVFIMKIGGILESGKAHDNRSPDYDDWELNGDILLWNDVLKQAFEISSMGIRVDKSSLLKQLELSGNTIRLNLQYHQDVLNDILPQTIGGGIGQSRLCMYFLEKKHIGEVQSSYWPQNILEECKKKNIKLL